MSLPVAEQRRRQAEIDALRIQRPLTEAERAEAERISAAEHMRAWRANLRETEREFA